MARSCRRAAFTAFWKTTVLSVDPDECSETFRAQQLPDQLIPAPCPPRHQVGTAAGCTATGAELQRLKWKCVNKEPLCNSPEQCGLSTVRAAVREWLTDDGTFFFIINTTLLHELRVSACWTQTEDREDEYSPSDLTLSSSVHQTSNRKLLCFREGSFLSC